MKKYKDLIQGVLLTLFILVAVTVIYGVATDCWNIQGYQSNQHSCDM